MKEKHSIEYNSTKEELIMPEYGRHVQEMLRNANTIEDPSYRQAYIEKIIGLMMQMVPQNRSIEDIREKMWKHVFRICDYSLDLVPPNGVVPTREEAKKKPPHPGYPVIEPKFRHYGHNVQELIRKALAMEEGELRDSFVEVIGSYMKLAYKTWNKEHYVSDDVIIDDIKILSDGKLILAENAELDNLAQANRRKQRSKEREREDNSRKRPHQQHSGGNNRKRFHPKKNR